MTHPFGVSDTNFDKPEPDYNGKSVMVGIVLAIIGLACGLGALSLMDDIVGAAFGIAFSLYFLGSVATFWLAELWKDGLTWGEAGVLAIWPYKVWKVLRATDLVAAFRSLGLEDGVANSDDPIENEDDAKMIGIIVSSFLVFVFGLVFLFSLIAASGVGLKMLLLLQVTGAAIYFWTMGFARRPLSASMIAEMVFWEIDMFRDLWKKVKEIRVAWLNKRTA